MCVSKVGKQLGQPPAFMMMLAYKPARGADVHRQQRKHTHRCLGGSCLTERAAPAALAFTSGSRPWNREWQQCKHTHWRVCESSLRQMVKFCSSSSPGKHCRSASLARLLSLSLR